MIVLRSGVEIIVLPHPPWVNGLMIVLRSGVEIIILPHPPWVNGIRSGSFNYWWGVNIRDVSVLETMLEITMSFEPRSNWYWVFAGTVEAWNGFFTKEVEALGTTLVFRVGREAGICQNRWLYLSPFLATGGRGGESWSAVRWRWSAWALVTPWCNESCIFVTARFVAGRVTWIPPVHRYKSLHFRPWR